MRRLSILLLAVVNLGFAEAKVLTAGDAISGTVVADVIANKDSCSKDELIPVLIRYNGNDLSGCVSGVDAMRVDWASQRVFISPTKISCTKADYLVKGWIVGTDGKAGVKGKMTNQNEMLIQAGTQIKLVLQDMLVLKNK
jgi:hypothetical protein